MFSNAQLAIPFLFIVVVNKHKFIVKKTEWANFPYLFSLLLCVVLGGSVEAHVPSWHSDSGCKDLDGFERVFHYPVHRQLQHRPGELEYLPRKQYQVILRQYQRLISLNLTDLKAPYCVLFVAFFFFLPEVLL